MALNRSVDGEEEVVPGEELTTDDLSSESGWVSWATGTPTIQISGFTYPYNEPDSGIIKIGAPEGACAGCANRLKFDPGDWNWCPDQKGTPRQFECSKLRTAQQVIDKLKEILI